MIYDVWWWLLIVSKNLGGQRSLVSLVNYKKFFALQIFQTWKKKDLAFFEQKTFAGFTETRFYRKYLYS